MSSIKNISISDFVQGGFYVDTGSDYDSANEIRSGWIDTGINRPLIRLTISVDCGDLQWSFICCDDQSVFRPINESLGYKNSRTVIDLSAYAWVRKIRVELHANEGLAPPQTCTLTVNYGYWEMIDGKLTNTEFLPLPEKAMADPYPLSLWRIENAELKTGLMSDLPEKAMTKPYPFALWRIEDGKLRTGLMPEIEELGAFCHASKLKKVSIPTTCKHIGEFAFRFTALKSVKLPEECEYYSTSFPEGCAVSGGILIDTESEGGDT